MDERIRALFAAHKIEYCEALQAKPSLIINENLYARSVKGFADSVIVFLVPYATSFPEKHNVSLYAAPKDYHLYMKALFADIVPECEKLFPGKRFKGMSDHSPINETLAAAECGLGVIGDNTRLINEKYGSYVFIGEIFTDADVGAEPPSDPGECVHCGACKKACPGEFGKICLSAITQKKGRLTESETELIRRSGSVWGCDVCQEVCPMNVGKPTTGIDYFTEDLIFDLDQSALDNMPDEEFAERAFSWRGRAVPERNIALLQGNDPV